ncbi:SDR family oxidoreductase [Lampropedia aestuarii]|uniref:SDR family oxidoreductase n=1 Tax=Lampropedia aestuarii TaxID=2562762 RepID=A0A4S5BEG5_9BURK|nr:SDR family oxidoreductase [Lampropedia aestuarii]THJ30664.1 SDR family oxidoreductase [Lampropedia aestuarii]
MLDNPIQLDGKIAVVTGASGGIGRAIVQRLRAQGATVIPTDVQVPVDADALFYQLDVTDTQAIEALAQYVHTTYGRLDIWVNNAGMLARSDALDLDESMWDKTLNINLRASVFGCQAAAQVMKAGGGGALVNLSSYAGLKARPNCIDYASAKAAIHHATKCLSLEFGPHNIRVNAIAPGYIDTPMSAWMHADAAIKAEYLKKTSVGRLGNPDEIALGVLYLVSPMASYVTGHTLVIDGGVMNS